MKKDIPAKLTAQICDLLSPLEAGEQVKILHAVNILLGMGTVALPPSGAAGAKTQFNQNNANGNSGLNNGNAKQFFDLKSPQNKGEEFAVAAKFALDNGQSEVHTIDSLRNTIKAQARRHFDAKNFVRDMTNAISNAKFFMYGDTKGEYLLSSDGEKYADALPDRSVAKAVRKGTKKAKKKKAA